MDRSAGFSAINPWLLGCLFVAFLMLAIAPAANASHGPARRLPGGAIRTTYVVGPLNVTPGQNRIAYRPVLAQERPSVDGWITKIKPNLVRADGTTPLSNEVMFHHGVWINLSRRDATSGGQERFYATGEEKTAMEFPPGFGYRYKASDVWLLNHMIHNLTPQTMTLYISYTVDFIPDTSPAAAGITPVRPIWMDVQNGSNYPVFDVHRGDGGKDGKYTYPNDATDPYPPGIHKNQWTVDQDGVLMASVGHVHSGGLSTDLTLTRPGAKYAGPVCKKKKKATSKKQRRKIKKAMRKCRKTRPKVVGDSVHIFHSGAHYFEPAGPVSWDVSMVGTKPNWRVAVKAGDTLGISTTYDSKIASWYESMGIEITYMAEGIPGRNPFKKRVDYPGVVNHGHLPENRVHGGKTPTVGSDPSTLPDGTSSGGPFQIGGFAYGAGDYRLPGSLGRPPVVHHGQSLTFQLASGDVSQEIWHSLTSCKSPCNRSTGIAYPIADGKFQFDSGQLGTGGAPTVNRTDWSTPADLPPGTYTYFCRIHPLMRGAFRVVN